MSKVEFVERLSEKLVMPRKDVAKIADIVFDTVVEELIENGKLNVSKFGAFKINETKPRKARNPATGEEVLVPAGRKLSFKPSSVIKAQISR